MLGLVDESVYLRIVGEGKMTKKKEECERIKRRTSKFSEDREEEVAMKT